MVVEFDETAKDVDVFSLMAYSDDKSIMIRVANHKA